MSLNLKMTVAILAGIVFAFCMYLFCMWFENYVVEVYYTSDKVVEKNVNAAYDSLEEYVEKYHVEATDRKALARWVADQKYTYFFVYDNHSNVFEAGLWVTTDSETQEDVLADEDAAFYNNIQEADASRIDEESFQSDIADTKNRIVEFEDDKYYVYIDIYKEQHWHEIMSLVTVVLCFLTLLATLLLYNKRTLSRIIILSSEVQQISDGKLDYEIHSFHNDEIGKLSASVDNMRNSIIQKHQNEKEAWDANTQLITAMSHDIRTPLTSMIGYLDIIEGKKYRSQEELDKYISSCRDKAFQLKDLSDKLFQYFLVFGNQGNDRTLERYDAGILFQQLLAEHCAEAMNYGYNVEFQYGIPEEVDIMTDISGLRRLFDNVFSNIMKYALKKEPIGVKAELDHDRISIQVTNSIWEQAKKVESTRIGLKTCERICSDLQGSFVYQEDEHLFTVEIVFPVAKKENADDGDGEMKQERISD